MKHCNRRSHHSVFLCTRFEGKQVNIVPRHSSNGIHCIAKWSRDRLSTFVIDGLGQKGCDVSGSSVNGVKGNTGSLPRKTIHIRILDWPNGTRNIIFDSGMSTGGSRNRSQFRAGKQWWKDNAFKVVIES